VLLKFWKEKKKTISRLIYS